MDDRANCLSTSEAVLATSLLHDPINKNIDLSLQEESFQKEIESKLEESGSKRHFEGTSVTELLRLGSVGVGTSFESPTPKKSKLNNVKNSLPTLKNKKQEGKLAFGKPELTIARTSLRKVIPTSKRATKKAKKVTAPKYIRKPEHALGFDEAELHLDSNNNNNNNNTSDSLETVHASFDACFSLDLSSIIEETSTGGPLRVLKTVAATDLTVYLVMAVITAQEFSDSDTCKWIISSKRTKYTGFNEKFGRQFNAYKVLYNIVRCNSATENGKKLLNIIKETRYITPKKLNGWFLVFDEIPALLENVSMLASIHEQSMILKFARSSKDPCVSKEFISEFAQDSDYGSRVLLDEKNQSENSGLKKFIDRLENILELEVERNFGTEERMENVINELEHKKHSKCLEKRHQILEVHAIEESEFWTQVGHMKSELASIQEKIDFPSENIPETGNKETKVDQLQLGNMKIQTLEALTNYLESQVRSLKIVLDVLNRKLFHVEMRYFLSVRNELPVSSIPHNSTELPNVSSQTMSEPPKTSAPNSIYIQSEPGNIKCNESSIKCEPNLDSSFEDKIQNCSKNQDISVRSSKDFEVEINCEQHKPTCALETPIRAEKSVQCDLIQKDHMVLEIPCFRSQTSTVDNRMSKIRQNIVKAALCSRIKSASNKQCSSLVVFKNLVNLLTEYEVLLDYENSYGTGSIEICTGQEHENIRDGNKTKNNGNCDQKKFMKPNEVEKDETAISNSFGTSTMTTLFLCPSRKTLQIPNDYVDEAGIALKVFNDEYPLIKESQICDRKSKEDINNLQKTSDQHTAHLSLETCEHDDKSIFETCSLKVESGVSESDDVAVNELEFETCKEEKRCISIFDHEESICSKLDSLYTELYFSIDEDPSLIHPIKFVSIDGTYRKMHTFSHLFSEVICIRREQNEKRNHSSPPFDSHSTLVSSMECLIVEISGLFHNFTEFCNKEIQPRSSVIALQDKCDHLYSAVLMAKEKIESLSRQFNWVKNEKCNYLSPLSIYSYENQGIVENPDVDDSAALQKRNVAMEAKLRAIEEQLTMEKRNRKLIKNRLDEALADIDKLVVVWDLLELRNGKSSFAHYETLRSSVSSHDMRLLEQITGLSQTEIRPEFLNRIDVNQNP